MSKAKQLVDSTIAGHKIVVFSKTYCPYCTKAKRALQRFVKPDQVKVIEIETLDDCNEIQNYLAQLTGGRSVPRVFIAGEFIGGGDDTDAAARSGKLPQLLKAAGVPLLEG